MYANFFASAILVEFFARGFVCTNGQDDDKTSAEKEKIKGSFMPFHVNLFRIFSVT